MKRHQNEKGIAIIVVIAIMVALMMIVTALLGTVTRMGDTAKSYKYDSLLRLGCLSGRACAMDALKNDAIKKKQLTEAREYTDGESQYFDKEFKYLPANGDNAFFVLRSKYYALDLGGCLSLNAFNDAGEREKKVYSEMKDNVEAVGAQNEEVDILGLKKTIGALIDDYKFADVLQADKRYYTFNDVGQQVNKDDIFESSLVFSPYGVTTSPLKYDVKTVPAWLLASMIGNYRNYQYQVGGEGGANVSLSQEALKRIYDKIIAQRKVEGATAETIRDEVFKVEDYKSDAEFKDPVSDQQKTNAAIERLVHSLFGSGNVKYVVKAGDTYTVNNFTGELVDSSSSDLSRYYRVIVRAELENLASGDIVAERYYEFVYDKKRSDIVSSRWFEME